MFKFKHLASLALIVSMLSSTSYAISSAQSNALDSIRIQEGHPQMVAMDVKQFLIKIGYSAQEANVLAEKLLNFENMRLSAKEVIARHEATKQASGNSAVESKIKSLDTIRFQEGHFQAIEMQVKTVLMEIGYSAQEAKVLSRELLNYENNGLSSKEIIARYEANK